MPTFATAKTKREHSSAGLEHLPYKQGVTGSNPVAPTTLEVIKFFIVYFKCFGGLHNWCAGLFFFYMPIFIPFYLAFGNIFLKFVGIYVHCASAMS